MFTGADGVSFPSVYLEVVPRAKCYFFYSLLHMRKKPNLDMTYGLKKHCGFSIKLHVLLSKSCLQRWKGTLIFPVYLLFLAALFIFPPGRWFLSFFWCLGCNKGQFFYFCDCNFHLIESPQASSGFVGPSCCSEKARATHYHLLRTCTVLQGKARHS